MTPCTAPAPPHYATSLPPGRRSVASRANSSSWSRTQWNVAVEKMTSTGSGKLRSSKPRFDDRGAGEQPLPGKADHLRIEVDANHSSTRQPFQQPGCDPASATAGIQNGLVASQLQAAQ